MGSLLNIAKTSWKFLAVLALIGGLFGAHPYIGARIVAGEDWQGIVPKFTEDSLYYMTRASSVAHEGPTVNPYYTKTYDAPSPSITLIDNILGVPYLFLTPFAAAVTNTFLWSAIFALLYGWLMLLCGFSRKIIFISWLIVVGSIFQHLLRTGHTQIMYPYFLVFFTLLLLMWQRSAHAGISDKQALVLGVCAGLTPYLYTFLFQIIFASLFFGVALSIILRRMQLARTFVFTLTAMVVISIPYFVYFKEITDLPYFGETMNRYLGVRSHMMSAMVYFYGRWLIVLLAWSFVLWLSYTNDARKKAALFPASTSGPSLESAILTIAATALGTLGVMVGNLVTGFDVQGISHAYYFVHVLLPLGLIFYALPTFVILKKHGVYVQKIILVLCVLILVQRVASTIPPELPKPFLYRIESPGPQPTRLEGNPQYLMPILTAIKERQGTRVVLSPEPVNGYIPLYTGKHVLFNFYAGMYLVGNIESVERSFASRLGKQMTRVEVEQAYYDAELLNTEVQQRNRVARELCVLVSTSPRCATLVVAGPYDPKGVINQTTWYDYYERTVRPNVLAYLHAYGVTDVVVDRRGSVPELLHGERPWYEDEYFAIYDITLLTK